ncbi:hypothetical protein PIROE2DRAFT_18297 [Piromyces sp. E2]|nr:hypothetical protein PIROE2DRAFT_18297 [Piromyces sp. E2]|eukprot:OUM56891.1 hypothetical protein PIROE2DRAFT_18297 [Piromyces sp. E2]
MEKNNLETTQTQNFSSDENSVMIIEKDVKNALSPLRIKYQERTKEMEKELKNLYQIYYGMREEMATQLEKLKTRNQEKLATKYMEIAKKCGELFKLNEITSSLMITSCNTTAKGIKREFEEEEELPKTKEMLRKEEEILNNKKEIITRGKEIEIKEKEILEFIKKNEKLKEELDHLKEIQQQHEELHHLKEIQQPQQQQQQPQYEETNTIRLPKRRSLRNKK